MAGHLDAAAWAHLADTPPPPTEHRCTSCRRRCRPCAEGEACGGAEWCSWCENAYSLNPPAADGRVYCGGPDEDAPAAEDGCGRYLPDLAALIARGLDAYPLYCGECRDRRAERSEPVPERPAPGPELDGDGPASTSGVTGPGAEEQPAEPVPAPSRPATPADPEAVALARHLTGGFRPRTSPTPAPGAPVEPTYVSEWGEGQTTHPLHAAREQFGDGWGR